MNTNGSDDDDTSAAPTTSAAGDDETTIVPDIRPTQAAAGWAWSSDVDTDDFHAPRGATWVRIAALAVGCVLVGAALAIIGVSVWWPRPAAHPEAAPPTTVAASTVAAPPPASSPVAASPPDVVLPSAAPAPTAAPPPPPPPAPAPPPAPPGEQIFVMCPGGGEGVVGGHTTCAFADNVRRAFYACGRCNEFTAFSPVTNEEYAMECETDYIAHFTNGAALPATRCDTESSNAEVVIW